MNTMNAMPALTTNRLSSIDRHARSASLRLKKPPKGNGARLDQELLKSEEYEWTTVLNLPGLIALAPAVEPPASAPHPVLHGEILETEDGDATHACQLPGSPGSDFALRVSVLSTAPCRDELDETDEYTDRAAMQMPSGLVESRVDATGLDGRGDARGLCASCLHHSACEFPRPASGVWQCDEYA